MEENNVGTDQDASYVIYDLVFLPDPRYRPLRRTCIGQESELHHDTRAY